MGYKNTLVINLDLFWTQVFSSYKLSAAGHTNCLIISARVLPIELKEYI